MTISCTQCGKELDRQGPDRVAVMAGFVLGDEYIETWFLCPACGAYTKKTYHDRFLGDDSIHLAGPIGKPRGDAAVALIRQCPDPLDKWCTCPAHTAYFGAGPA
ncbi:MAG: hypothetical protein NTV86_17510 [Planctomycetota bacterium]|nr:hypothetical protein [Planctomycetota bacterium]